MIPLWEAVALIAATIASAVVTGLAFYLAGRRYQDAQEHRDAILTDARDQSSRTYATMEGTLHRMSERLDVLEQEGDRDRQRIMSLSNRVQALEDGISILIRQIRGAGMEPDWKPDNTVMTAIAIRPVELAQRIRASFDIDEMNDLAQRIGLDPEDVKGDTATRRASALVDSANRRGLLGLLIETCRELRPQREWQ